MRLLRLKEVCKTTGLPRSSLYEAIKCGEFPVAVRISRRSVAWNSDEIASWMDTRPPANNKRCSVSCTA